MNRHDHLAGRLALAIGQAVRRGALALLALLVVAALFYVWAGYYGSDVFRFMAAPKSNSAKPALVIFSGDMGDRIGMASAIADRLNARGYAVVSVNSLAYFSKRRTSKDVASLIETAIGDAEALGKSRQVVLIGQSLGADMLHAGLAELPAGERRPIRAVILIVPGNQIVFRASPIELVGLETPDQPALATASSLTWVPVTCIFGKEEAESLCPELKLPNVERIALPGGHHLRFDDAALERAVVQSLPTPAPAEARLNEAGLIAAPVSIAR